MVPGQNSGKPDLEQGYVSKRTTISPATDQNIDQIDYGEFTCIHAAGYPTTLTRTNSGRKAGEATGNQ